MLEKIYISEPKHTDLNMYRCGMEDCKSGHTWGPAIRDHYIIHYILGGKGIFQVNGMTHHLGKDDGFLICPNNIIFYQADADDPWSYSWVGFHGLKAENYLKQANLTPDNPIFRYDRDDFLKDCLNRMLATKSLVKSGEIRLLGLLYEFLSQLIEVAETVKNAGRNEHGKEMYIKKVIEFIGMNYSGKISIMELARQVGLDRSYLYSIFNEYLHVSPREYLISYRMNKACDLMQNSDLSIGDISRSIGYDDPLLFSKVFKKVKGVSPREFRKRAAF